MLYIYNVDKIDRFTVHDIRESTERKRDLLQTKSLLDFTGMATMFEGKLCNVNLAFPDCMRRMQKFKFKTIFCFLKTKFIGIVEKDNKVNAELRVEIATLS